MRRDINIRKRKRTMIQKINTKSLYLLVCLVVIMIVCMFFYVFYVQNSRIKSNLENDNLKFTSLNEYVPFSIYKIILFSSATATTNSINQSLSLDIAQYCDIGIYLNNMDKEHYIIQSLYINDINISKTELGKPCLYRKRIHDLGKCSFESNDIIENEFAFQIIKNKTTLNEDNYELYNDGSTPISLGFYNSNIKNNFIINHSEILYNGTLLKTALIPQSSINCDVSFTLHIVTTNGEHYIGNIHFSVPFEDEDGSLYDTGYVSKTITNNEIGKLIRIE